ncbi:MAG: M20/M25/M40 family metallo-hydrolase [Candidatus Coatesbacteria bacterium]|nr:M20/M25/M40 family metallo-hydrolase [Candidatus Coatesbacteria bacterium]
MKNLFSGKASFEFLNHLSVNIGARLGGSREEKKAAYYILERFKEWGLKSYLQEFKTKDFSVKKSFITSRETGDIHCRSYGLCSNTPTKGITSDIVWCLSGSPLEITPDIKNKIIVRYGALDDKLRKKMDEYEPAGVIVIGSSRGTKALHIERLEEWDKILANQPTLMISYDDGLKLVKAKPKKMTIITEQDIKPSTSQNVIGELKGGLYPEEIIVVCGHYDSIWEGSGASDNAGGTAIVMELARIFSIHGSKRTIRFIAFGSEERGLNGSRYYIKELAKKDKKEKEKKEYIKIWDKTELDNHLLTINIDVHGALLGTNHVAVAGCSDHIVGMQLLSKELGFKLDIKEYAMSSDGTSLAYHGIPALQFARSSPSNNVLHTEEDTISWLDRQALEDYGRFLEILLFRWVSCSAEFPLERKISDENVKKIKAYFLKHLKLDMEAGLETKKKK